ncbi:MAG: calcium-binding protein [Sulfitobacter sp.]|nr:calcium-binding protein [Sulfitobacter sp.]
MIFALIAVALAAVSGLAGFASDQIEEELDQLEEDLTQELEQFDIGRFFDSVSENFGNELDEVFGVAPDGPGTDETLQGTAGEDTLEGDAGDADRLEGAAGADLLILADGNSASGGEGSDQFEITAGADAVIEDFRPGEDLLRIRVDEPVYRADVHYALDWQITDAGAELHYALRGAVDDAADSRIVTLTGLTTPPPATDIELVITDSAQEGSITLTGDELNFLQRVEGTAGGDSFVLDDDFSEYELATGAGDDTVTFDSFRGQTDLGDGNDTYRSAAELRFGNPFQDASETVLGSAGDDLIEGGTAGFVADGGAGNDTISAVRTDQADIFYADLRGGAGDDNLIFGDQAFAEGGTGADTFTVSPVLVDRPAMSQIDDFDPEEDALIIQLHANYDGPGELTLGIASFGYGSAVLVDGTIAVQFSDRLADLSGIVVMQ